MYSDQFFFENKIKEYIINNNLQPNDKFPSERFLVENLGISRSQTRRVLKSLVDQGILSVKKNSGYYLTPRRIIIQLNEQHSYFNPTTENLVRTRFITINEISFNSQVSQILDSNDGIGYELLGLQTTGKTAYGVISSYFTLHDDKEIDQSTFETKSLFEIFSYLGRPIAHMKEEVSSATSTEYEEKLLNLPKNSPLTKHEIYCYDEQGSCILYQIILYPIFEIEFRGWSM